MDSSFGAEIYIFCCIAWVETLIASGNGTSTCVAGNVRDISCAGAATYRGDAQATSIPNVTVTYPMAATYSCAWGMVTSSFCVMAVAAVAIATAF